MIKRLSVKNYRSLVEVVVDFSPLTVLVGQNGSGKSSVIDVLRFVSDALRLGLKTALRLRAGMSALRRWSPKGRPFDIQISLNIETALFAGEYSFVLGSERLGEYGVKAERCSVQPVVSDLPAPRRFDADTFSIHQGKWEQSPAQTSPVVTTDTLALPLIAGISPYKEMYDFLTGMSFYTIFPKLLREHQGSLNPFPLEEDASNLASLLDNLQGEARQNFRLAVQFVIPDIDDYQVRQAGSRLMIKLRHPTGGAENPAVEQEERVPWFELAQESDGTLRMLALLAALHQDPPRTLVALEEPELTVHPGVMPRLWEKILDASVRSQVLLTTHSPDLLDLCSAEQIRVVEKIGGITHVGPIDDVQRKIIREKLFTAGQLLQAQGLLRYIEAVNDAQ